MDWWQILLIILISVVVGLLIGGLLSRLIARLLKKPFITRRETAVVFKEPVKPTLPKPVVEKPLTPIAPKPVVEKPPTPIAPDLVGEVENNHRIATEPWTGKLLPFQTSVWDRSRDEIHSLSANLREDLTEAYVDIRLANSIVWVSAELGRKSPNLDDNYIKLRTNIALRLTRVMPLLEKSGN